MGRHNIAINLYDTKSVENAIKQLTAYRNELQMKCQEVCRRLSDEGIKVANVAIDSVPIGKTIVLTLDMEPSKFGCRAIMKMDGRETKLDDGRTFYTAFAIEFGAGIKYNSSANPKAKEFGMGVGTFPNQKHAFDPNGWMYLGDDGEWHHSYGVKASMPMYSASVEMRKKIDEIIKEVFR